MCVGTRVLRGPRVPSAWEASGAQSDARRDLWTRPSIPACCPPPARSIRCDWLTLRPCWQAIDAPLKRLLETGAIRILNCEWLLKARKASRKSDLPHVTNVRASLELHGKLTTAFDMATKHRLLHEVADRIGLSRIAVVIDAEHERRDDFVASTQLALFRSLFRPNLADGHEAAADKARKPPFSVLQRIQSQVRQLQERLEGVLAADSLERQALGAFAEHTDWFWRRCAAVKALESAAKSKRKKKRAASTQTKAAASNARSSEAKEMTVEEAHFVHGTRDVQSIDRKQREAKEGRLRDVRRSVVHIQAVQRGRMAYATARVERAAPKALWPTPAARKPPALPHATTRCCGAPAPPVRARADSRCT